MIKYVRVWAFFAIFVTLLAPAFAQWQTPNHSVPIGRGSGAIGFGSAAPGAAGNVLVSTGPTSDPTLQPPTTLFDNVFCATVGYAIFRATGVWKCDRSIPISITLFGAVADSGVTDNQPFIQAAVDYAAANGIGAIKIPRVNGWFGVSTCRNNAVIDMTSLTVPNGNKSVSIYGDGWSEKPFATPTGSWILPTSSFPNTCSFIRLSGSDKVAGTVYDGFGIGEFGGSLGTPKGLHMIFWDASNPAYYQQNMKINNVYLGNTASGYSFKCTTGSSATPGCMPDSSITNSKFMNFNADFLADHVTITKNTVAQNATNDARNVGFQFANCGGCTTTYIAMNNISSISAALIYDGGQGLVFGPNEIEQPPFTNLNGVSVWLRGSTFTVVGATVDAPKISLFNAVNTVSPITVGTSQDASIRNPWLVLPTGSVDPHITIAAGSSGTTVRDASCWVGGAHSFGCSVTNAGIYVGWLDQLFLGLAGTVDGKTGQLYAPSNADGRIWTLPDTTQTLIGRTSVDVLTGKSISGSTNTLSNIGNASLTNSSITINGSSVSLGGSVTVGSAPTGAAGGDLSGTYPNPLVSNLTTGVTVAGTMLHSNIAAPATPASGKVLTWTDSTDLRFHDKNSAGVIGTTVVADTGAANQYVSAISAAGAITKSRPACNTLSDAGLFCNGTSVANLTGTTLPATIVTSSLTSVSTLTGGATGAGFTIALSTSTVTGTLPAGNFPALAGGDITTPGGSLVATLNTVNSNVGTFGSATQAPQFTVNGKGLITAASNVTITPAFSSLTGNISAAQMDNVAWGNFTPAATCGSASFTTTSATFKTWGKTTMWEMDLTISAMGTCSGGAFTWTTPNTPQNAAGGGGAENVTLGVPIGCIIVAGSTTANCLAQTGLLVNSRFRVSGVYTNQ